MYGGSSGIDCNYEGLDCVEDGCKTCDISRCERCCERGECGPKALAGNVELGCDACNGGRDLADERGSLGGGMAFDALDCLDLRSVNISLMLCIDLVQNLLIVANSVVIVLMIAPRFRLSVVTLVTVTACLSSTDAGRADTWLVKLRAAMKAVSKKRILVADLSEYGVDLRWK